ncbi:MAG TPA: CAP domain-containing protein [Prolixibacteraceae bacterium]|nr:CAP domain-containing protein [Prolixibacteraceae bacterium]HPS12453.1 CAP domain-containing protein [Prolixibacteraceae bacterium]
MNRFVFVVALAFTLLEGCKEDEPINPSDSLVAVINHYRQQHQLPAIPESASLNLVAETHVRDLCENYVLNDECNIHSWSDKGNWTPFCYTADKTNSQYMWDKPRELTSYKGNGYEIAAYRSDSMSAMSALELWENSEPHLDLILNRNTWKEVTWKAIGGAILGGYAVVWFGERSDTIK